MYLIDLNFNENINLLRNLLRFNIAFSTKMDGRLSRYVKRLKALSDMTIGATSN